MFDYHDVVDLSGGLGRTFRPWPRLACFWSHSNNRIPEGHAPWEMAG